LLDSVEEAFDQIALLVEPGREAEALLAVGTVGNVGPDISRGSSLADCVAVIALVAQQGCTCRNSLDQSLGLTGIVNLAA